MLRKKFENILWKEFTVKAHEIAEKHSVGVHFETVISGAPFKVIILVYANDNVFKIGEALVYPYASGDWKANVTFYPITQIKPSIYNSYGGINVRNFRNELIKQLSS